MTDLLPDEFVRSIYLGDRRCLGLNLKSDWVVEILVDNISRIRGDTWNYDNSEDIRNGAIVLSGVEKIEWDSSGGLPNDEISSFVVHPAFSDDQASIFELVVASVSMSDELRWLTLKIHARGICLANEMGDRIYR